MHGDRNAPDTNSKDPGKSISMKPNLGDAP